MKYVLIVLLGISLLCIITLVICFFLIYWETIKTCKNIRKYYTSSISVKCTSIDQKIMHRNYADHTEGHCGNIRVRYNVSRPYFQGQVDGKMLTFVRTNDIHQPKCEVGKGYTIFLRHLEHIDCKDFYEKREIAEMNMLIKKKKKQYIISIVLCVIFAVVVLAIMIYFF